MGRRNVHYDRQRYFKNVIMLRLVQSGTISREQVRRLLAQSATDMEDACCFGMSAEYDREHSVGSGRLGGET